MLVISRKLGEKLYIGANVVITVVDIDRGKIRLGIEAPKEIGIFRPELLPKETVDAIESYARTGIPVTSSEERPLHEGDSGAVFSIPARP